ncbi:MarR family transcriptional regulator [Solwaraspora sp. WMMA2056]|uniref:MarR family winged helix-turn-helix transcriptional regulator n=1 Tax=Solwaraspora sp. WMMA2056 TaxID=3015161 RepID=UPI00259B140F|nr:MarR family transcriptional regulator [Solwaraspora sp. WMMA2056]WJK43239.1 MarR family transcriptional regulator [Solwaraspora sp. WMMA2056]
MTRCPAGRRARPAGRRGRPAGGTSRTGGSAVAKLYRSAQADVLAGLALHPGQDVLLWIIGQEPGGLTVSEVAARLGVEQPTVTRSLSRLEPGGWFVRQSVPGDRRLTRIVLTDKGRTGIAQIEAAWRTLATETD